MANLLLIRISFYRIITFITCMNGYVHFNMIKSLFPILDYTFNKYPNII